MPRLIWLAMLPGCYYIMPTDGGGMIDRIPEQRAPEAADVLVPDGWRVEVVATGLHLPTSVAFDDDGGVYVLEAGYSYGELFATPRIVRVRADGGLSTVAEGAHPPWNGFVWHDGGFLVAQGGEVGGGRIVRFDPDGEATVLVDDLPSLGDHHTNGPVVGPDGFVYFGQGTATNSGVVGPDNADFGWLLRHPDFHDTPCEDIVLAGVNYPSPDVLTEGSKQTVWTGAYVPFGTPTQPQQVIKGSNRCNGAVLRIPAAGGEPEVVAWGLRNPFGLAFAPDGTLYATDNAYDERGSRPVFGTADYMRRIEPGSWHGWPDYAGAMPLDDERWAPRGEDAPVRLLARTPGTPPEPVAKFGVHASANGFDFAPSDEWGGQNVVYVALFGDMAPNVGKVLAPVGFRVVRVDVSTGEITDFVANEGDTVGPATWVGNQGIERPVDARFGPDGALYVVDFGILAMNEQGANPVPRTGVLWRVSREGTAPIAIR